MSSSTLVVGAQGHAGAAGEVQVFTRSGFRWSQKATLKVHGAVAGDHFGNAVAISGSTVVVGAEGVSSGAGALYVFQGAGRSWKQVAKLTAATAGAWGQLGWSVAIAGSTIVAGAPNDEGAVFVFTRRAGRWQRSKMLRPTDEAAGDGFGYNVAYHRIHDLRGVPLRERGSRRGVCVHRRGRELDATGDPPGR